MASALPPPSEEASAHSRQLVDYIQDRIRQAGGWISFADYMSCALYAPGLGYYTAGARKFGAAGDFVTAPELTPLFGQVVAAQAAQVLHEVGGDVLELGAGSGRLAVGVLRELDRMGSLPEHYYILDVSADLQERQRAFIETEIPELAGRVAWLDALPGRFNGIVLGNEVLDAMPVHLVRWRGDLIFERGVALDAESGFIWHDRPLDNRALSDAASAIPNPGEDYLSEVGLAAMGLVHSLADRLERGLILFMDYGFPRREYYHPDRMRGTLMCHYRHHAFDAPFFYPGLTDITSHVDFTAIADAALDTGLDVMGFTDQARFLINTGILSKLEGYEPGSNPYLRELVSVQKLLQPAEMGELFKVIALGRGLEGPLLGFASGDRRHAL